MGTEKILTYLQPNGNTPHPPINPKLTNRQIALIIGRKAVAALLGELYPAALATFDRADLRTAKATLGELLAETEVTEAAR